MSASSSTFLRCAGHCCKRFALHHSYEALQREYAIWKQDPSKAKIPDIEKIGPMVIPLASNPDKEEFVYTCKNLRQNGDCGIYEARPQMCRDFPTAEGCHFWKCESSQSAYFGIPFWKKIIKRITWLRSL